jgi:hypothetical protein
MFETYFASKACRLLKANCRDTVTTIELASFPCVIAIKRHSLPYFL